MPDGPENERNRKDDEMKSKFMAAIFVCASFAALAVTPCCADDEESSAAAPTDAPEKRSQESPKPSLEAISAEFMRQVMETSARIEAVRKEIEERERFIYENNQEIKALRSQMKEIQKTISGILDEDEELAALKMDRDILWSIMPALPSHALPRPMMPHAPAKGK